MKIISSGGDLTRMVLFHHGDPDVFHEQKGKIAAPQRGEVLLRHTAIGINFVDVYYRTGLYLSGGAFPLVVGQEAAGIVEAVGPEVTDFRPGDRVAYCESLGAYASHRLVLARFLVPLPDDVEDYVAAAVLLKGLTAQYLLRQTYRVKAGETILFHAAAGATGSLACQWANHLGVKVIGTVGSEEKIEAAIHNGCSEVVLYKTENVAERIKALTGGAGVPVVYDGIGKATFITSLDCLKPRGLLVSFGNASGQVDNVNLAILAQKGSVYVTRPVMGTYTGTRDTLLSAADELFSVIRSGAVKPASIRRLPLTEASRAHRDLEAGTTTGATILIP